MIYHCIVDVCCVLSVGGPSVSVAVKRSADFAADGAVKRLSVEPVKRNNSQVRLSEHYV